MNNSVASINQIVQSQNTQTSSTQFDLSDETFDNLLEEKLKTTEQEESQQENIMNKLGIPIGLNIEGFDYTSKTEPNDKVNAINTDSDIQGDKGIDISSFLDNAKEILNPSVNSVVDSFNAKSLGKSMKEIKNYWQNQASNYYSSMDKKVVSNIEDLISKL